MTPGAPQALAALKRANEVRLARSAVKHQLRDGTMSLEDALDDPAVQTMEIGLLLEAQWGWGELRVVRLLGALRNSSPSTTLDPRRHVGALTDRERAAIVRACKESTR